MVVCVGGVSFEADKELDEIYRDSFNGGNVKSCNIEGTQVFILAIENNIAYIFTHILQHFYQGGIGLRQICDWCRLIWANKDSLNMKILEKRLKKMKVMSEWRGFSSLAVDLLGMPSDVMPFYSSSKKWKCKARRICEYVLETGNFGHNKPHDNRYLQYPTFIRKIVTMRKSAEEAIRLFTIYPFQSLRVIGREIVVGIDNTFFNRK